MEQQPSRLIEKIDEERSLVTCPECNQKHVTKFYSEEQERYLYCDACIAKMKEEEFPTCGGVLGGAGMHKRK